MKGSQTFRFFIYLFFTCTISPLAKMSSALIPRSYQGLRGIGGPINWGLRKANDPFYGGMAWVFLAMGTFCATDWPEAVVSLIFYFLLTPPECAWVTQNPGLMQDPRT